jgi:hypothetical protein
MIDRNIRIENLDPETWSGIGAVYDALQRYRETVFVLFRDGVVARIADSRNIDYERGLFDAAEPAESAARIFRRHELVDRVIVGEEKAFVAFYSKAQSSDDRKLDSDQFCDVMNGLLESQQGVSIFYRDGKKRSILSKTRELVEAKLPPECTVFLRVTDGGRDLFHCVAGFSARKLKALTTLDCLGEDVRALLSLRDECLLSRLSKRFPGELRAYRFELEELRTFAARN